MIVVFSGAGLSEESGVPTFRGANGLWENHKIEEVATPKGWFNDKSLVLKFYAERFIKAQQCQPNIAHHAIAELGRCSNVFSITQNIDGLQEAAGAKNVWHIHGSLTKSKCEYHSNIFGSTDPRFTCTYETDLSQPIKIGDLCPLCSAQLRPSVVWFGEFVDMKHNVLEKILPQTTIFIGVGTSAQVYPAANFLEIFNDVQEKYFIDMNPPQQAVLSSFTILKGKATEIMPKLIKKLKMKHGFTG